MSERHEFQIKWTVSEWNKIRVKGVLKNSKPNANKTYVFNSIWLLNERGLLEMAWFVM